MNKKEWGHGEWTFEPDRQDGVDETSGYPMSIRRTEMGHLCGYVGVHDSHPLYGKELDDEALYPISVHGGITWTSAEKSDDQPDGFWWFGFDCAHLNDLSPGLSAHLPEQFRKQQVYRTIEYVQAECESLAKQLYELSNDRAVNE